jgi:hypothetical protein
LLEVAMFPLFQQLEDIKKQNDLRVVKSRVQDLAADMDLLKNDIASIKTSLQKLLAHK